MVKPSILAASLSLLILACSSGEEQGQVPPSGEGRPLRIVSLDYCADQYVLRFADTEDILALSPDAARSFSYMRDEALGLPQVRPRSADVLSLRPGLVVRSYGGGPQVAGFLERAGVEVVQIGYPANIDEVRNEIVRLGSALGNAGEAGAVVADMDRRLDALKSSANPSSQALYITQGGVTTGPGSLVHELMREAGLDNFQKRPGWNPIPLERLAYEHPDIIVAAFFEGQSGATHNWSASRHPITQAQLDKRPVASIEGAWTACGGWFLIEAVEAMARKAHAQ